MAVKVLWLIRHQNTAQDFATLESYHADNIFSKSNFENKYYDEMYDHFCLLSERLNDNAKGGQMNNFSTTCMHLQDHTL